jgi:hypothetical protein
MAKRIRDHIRSHVVGYVALFVALSGTAYAVDGPLPGQNQVGSQDIINSEVRSEDIGGTQVRNSDLGAGAVTTGKIAAGGVRSLDVFDNTLTGADVNEASLGQVPSAAAWGGSRFREVWHSGSESEHINQINAGTCRLRAVEASTRAGDIVLGTVHGGSAPNPLPAGLTATFLLNTEGGATVNGQVLLRLCNSTASNVPAFNLNWQFVVIRDTNPN